MPAAGSDSASLRCGSHLEEVATHSSTPAIMPTLVDVDVLEIAAHGAEQVRAAMTVIGRCAHVPPWPPSPIHTVGDLRAAETAAALIRTRLSRRPCPCLRGLRAHVLGELLRRWQSVSCTGRLAIQLGQQASRAAPEFTVRVIRQARALTADTAWLTGPPPTGSPPTGSPPTGSLPTHHPAAAAIPPRGCPADRKEDPIEQPATT